MQDIGRQILLNVTKEAMNAHSMLPCVSMEDATHLTFGCSEARFQKQIRARYWILLHFIKAFHYFPLSLTVPGLGYSCTTQHNLRIVDEQIYVDPDDVVDPDETQGQARWNFEVVQGTGTQEVVTFFFFPIFLEVTF